MTAAPSADPVLDVTETSGVSAQEAVDIAELAAAASAADGVGPLDDQVRTELAFGAATGARHVLGREQGHSLVVAYGHLTQDAEGPSGHLVVHPTRRRRGFGDTMLDHLLGAAGAAGAAGEGGEPPTTSLRVWAHGDTEGAQALAATRGFRRVRDLWQMRRDLSPALPAASYPDDVTVRTFEPGRDDEAWLALNAAAFASHPEQGRLTVTDLHHRMAQPWFDPGGFFLAERDEALLGSHWTKVYPGDEGAVSSVGEVYAVGVHPAAQGLGLGKALTLTGLQHLRDAGLDAVILYVDGDNTAATHLYQRLGFVTTTVDVMYASPH